MKILGMGVPEMLIILVVVMLLFGPKNLPKLGEALGKTVHGIREGMEDDGSDRKGSAPARAEADPEDSDRPAPEPARAAAASAEPEADVEGPRPAAKRRTPAVTTAQGGHAGSSAA